MVWGVTPFSFIFHIQFMALPVGRRGTGRRVKAFSRPECTLMFEAMGRLGSSDLRLCVRGV